MANTGKTPKGVFSRSAKLFGMATQLAGQEIGRRLIGEAKTQEIEKRIAQAKIIAESLSQLKGAAMKAGQMLSLDTSDFLPPEATEVLSKLQSQATPHPTEDMQRILLQELGREHYARIRQFSEKALASASIGQLHSAQLIVSVTEPPITQPVAIKIQYPGIADSIDSDLLILKKLADTFLRFTDKEFSLDDAFKEMKHVLHRETDYEIERLNLEKYRALLQNDPDYIIPETYPDFSSKRVLTMSYEHGQHMTEFINQCRDHELKKKIAHLVLNLYCREFSDWGFVQTDPNFANFLVRGDKLVCLDFGATLEYDTDFRQGYARLLLGLKSNNTKEIFESAVRFGLIDPREDAKTQEAFKNMIQVTMAPFHPESQPFDFSDPRYEKQTLEANLAFTKSLVYSPPPRKIIFLHRKLAGIFNMVKRLNVALDLRPYWIKMTAPATRHVQPGA